jgi:predicted DCC family thiol-disulfide oxidoreductase YuxK
MTNTDSTNQSLAAQRGRNYLIYDGECPFCSRYARLVRLRETVGQVALIDARVPSPEVEAAKARGYVLDNGMLLCLDGNIYYGADCLNRLALLSSRSTAFNRLTYLLLRSPFIARWTYPILRSGRRAVLTLLGRKRLGF